MVAQTTSVHPKKSSQKMRNVLKQIFEFVRFLVFEIWSILYSTFVVNCSESKSIRGLGAEAKVGVVGSEAPLTLKKNLNSS